MDQNTLVEQEWGAKQNLYKNVENIYLAAFELWTFIP